VDSNDWQNRPDDDRLRALLLSLRYCSIKAKGFKSEILRLLVIASKDNLGEVSESISRMLFDQQYVESDYLNQLLDKSTMMISKLREHGISVLMIPDSVYPKRISLINDAPYILLAKGNLAALNPEKSIAVIGTRKADDVIYNAGIEISYRLAQEGWMIASGLAKGCDSAGHIGCIRGKGITTAILPSSIEKIYPSDNKGLAEEIVANNGCLLTEYLSTDQIQRYYFVQRDRLQAALSDNLLVLQTGIEGGTMHTVRYAHQYNKKVFAYMPLIDLPPQIDMTGNKELIHKNKAMGIADFDDLLERIQALKSNSEEEQYDPASSSSSLVGSNSDGEQLEIPGI